MKISSISILTRYIEEKRWDILSKTITVVLRNKNLKGIDLSKAKLEIKPSLGWKGKQLDILLYEEE